MVETKAMRKNRIRENKCRMAQYLGGIMKDVRFSQRLVVS